MTALQIDASVRGTRKLFPDAMILRPVGEQTLVFSSVLDAENHPSAQIDTDGMKRGASAARKAGAVA